MSIHPTERRIARTLIETGLARGYTVSVQDGEEWVVKRSQDADEAVAALEATGEDRILFRNDGERVGLFYLIWGNSNPDELIADYSDNPISNDLYRETLAANGY